MPRTVVTSTATNHGSSSTVTTRTAAPVAGKVKASISLTSPPPLPSSAWPLRHGAWPPWRPRRCGGLPRRARPCGPRPCARRAGSRGDLPLGLEDDHGAVEGLGELEEVRGGGVAGAALDLDHEGAGEAGPLGELRLGEARSLSRPAHGLRRVVEPCGGSFRVGHVATVCD